MSAHWKYLKYVLTHKYFVHRAGRALGLGHWQLIKHDWTKFQPIEWFAYVARMADRRNSTWESKEDTVEYQAAWAHHWQNNEHHERYWTADNPRWHRHGVVTEGFPKLIPLKFVLEMAVDKYGAGMAQGKPDIAGWHEANRHKLVLNPATLPAYERAIQMITAFQQAGKL